MHEKKKNRLFRFFLPILLSGIVFAVQTLVAASIIVGLILLHRMGWIDLYRESVLFPIALSAASLAIGALFSSFLLRRPLKPIQELMEASDRIAEGDYSVRVKPQGIPEFRDLGRKFNHMAEELESVEMLRNDFVNNFSHEFKTPIVSIRGFARMLERNDLPEDERKEYLGIIAEESERLVALSEHVLAMSKLEQQTILINPSVFNLSEQIRVCVTMFSSRIAQKGLEIVLKGGEVSCYGSEEMLKQVWINLLDNAVKFAGPHGPILITAKIGNDSVTVSVFNEGVPIPAEQRTHLFEKFYQGDSSHTTSGNGLGLAIVKRIVDLHSGTVSIDAEPNGNCFTVTLPNCTA